MSSLNGKVRAVVLGGGISGLAAARALEDRGYEPHTLESCPSFGGLTRTVKVGDYCFDYTGHFLHLARYPVPSAIPYAGLRDHEWQSIDRKSFCYVGGRLITAPIQYHLGELPSDILKQCIRAYDTRPPLAEGAEASFRDYIVSGFGQYLADLFLIPQNEKTMATSLDRLSIKAVKRFFPPPDENRVRAGIGCKGVAAQEYNSRFWYPKLGGIELLVNGLGRGLNHVWLLEKATDIDLRARKIRTQQGRVWDWHVLYSSLPLRILCALTRDEELMHWAQSLTHSSTISFNLGVRGRLRPEISQAHWVYVPDRAVPFYRAGFYSNISQGMCPSDCTSVYLEVGVPSEEIDRIDISGELQRRVISAFKELEWLEIKSIDCVLTHIMRCAYVHHSPSRERAVGQIMSRLAQYEIFPIGRYGLWDYMSMEDSIHSAVETVTRTT